MKKYVEQVVKILIYCTFIVPMVVVPSSFIFPFVVPKILLFRSLVVLLLAGYILLLLINWKEYRPYLTPVNVVVGLFLLSFTMSTIVGVDAYHSFWDNHERMLGLFTIIHYMIYYLVCTSVFKKWQDWQTVMRIFLLAGSIVMFIAVLQIFNPTMLLNRDAGRVASTLGNAIYVGGYGMFLMFMSFLLAVRDKKYSFWFWAEIAMGVLAVFGMLASGTRGVILAILAGVIVALILYLILFRDRKVLKISLSSVLLGVIILAALLYGFRQTNFVKNIPAVGRAVNTSLSEITGGPRWIAWEIAYVSWKEMPATGVLFGWGPNNYFYAFNKHYNPRSLNFGYGETWFDNAHNIVMNTLTVQGVVGLLIYLSMFIVGTVVLWRAYLKVGLNRHVVVVGIAFLAAHFVANVTVFDNPTSYLYFMFWLAFVNSISAVKELKTSSNKNIGYGSVTVVGVFALLLIFVFNIQPARANKNALQAIRVINQVPISSSPQEYLTLAILEAKTAMEFGSPHIDDIRSDIARSVVNNFNEIYTKAGADKANEMLELVYTHLKKNLVLHPLDIRNQLTMSQINRLQAIVYKDSKYVTESEKVLEDALSKSEKRQQVIYSLAFVKFSLNKENESIKLYEKAIELNSKIAESYWRLAYVYKQTGKLDKAKGTIDLAKKNGVIFTAEEQDIVDSIIK